MKSSILTSITREWVPNAFQPIHVTKAGSRHLSITSITNGSTIYGPDGNSAVVALLLFESNNGSINALLNVRRDCTSDLQCNGKRPTGLILDSEFGWLDASSGSNRTGSGTDGFERESALYESFARAADRGNPSFSTGEFSPANDNNLTMAGSMFGAPFTCGPSLGSDDGRLAVDALFYAGEGEPDSDSGNLSHGERANFLTYTFYNSTITHKTDHGDFASASKSGMERVFI